MRDEQIAEMTAALKQAQSLLRRLMKGEKIGTVRASANQLLHQINYALREEAKPPSE